MGVTPQMNDIIDRVIERIAELPARTSPNGRTSWLTVTSEELGDILTYEFSKMDGAQSLYHLAMLRDALAQARRALKVYQPDSAPTFYMEAIWNADEVLAATSEPAAINTSPETCSHSAESLTRNTPDRITNEHTDQRIFDLLEPLSDMLIETGGPNIKDGFARGTGGVDIEYVLDSVRSCLVDVSVLGPAISGATRLGSSNSYDHTSDVREDGDADV